MATMFKKYMLKLTNTVGTVQYLHKITKDNDRNNNDDDNVGRGKPSKKYRNSMTAEMLLDIGPLLPVVPPTTETGLHPSRTPRPRTPPTPDADSSSGSDPPSYETRPPLYPRGLDECDAALSRRSSTEEEDLGGDADADVDDTMVILSAAILQLRNTLLYYSLVLYRNCKAKLITRFARRKLVSTVIEDDYEYCNTTMRNLSSIVNCASRLWTVVLWTVLRCAIWDRSTLCDLGLCGVFLCVCLCC